MGVLDIPGDLCTASARAAASLPLAFGGIGLRSAVRTSAAAYWASWGDSLEMISHRHPRVAEMVRELNGLSISLHLSSASETAVDLARLPGFEVPTWDELVAGRRPPLRNIEEVEPGTHGAGWQHEAAARLDWNFRERLMVTLTESEQALFRSQSGTAAGSAFTVAPSHFLVRIESQLFRVLLLRRLRLPLPPSSRTCRCGRLLDSFGHHRASCALAGVLGRRGFALESAAARICREAGGRVATNVLVGDLDLPVPPNDGRRLEVVVDGLPVYGGAQLAVDTTLVSPLHCDGSARRGGSGKRRGCFG